MEPSEPPSRFGLSFRGATGLIAAIGVVVVLLVMLPAYRLFFGVSVIIGVVVAGGLYFWNKYKPIKEEDVQSPKRPLGL